MDKSQRVVKKANIDLQNAQKALEESYNSLRTIQIPSSGAISQMHASKTLLHSQREQITHNQEWINFAKNQLTIAKQQLKKDMIEYEKFKYLELEEIKKILKDIKIKEAKELDEIALITFNKKNK